MDLSPDSSDDEADDDVEAVVGLGSQLWFGGRHVELRSLTTPNRRQSCDRRRSPPGTAKSLGRAGTCGAVSAQCPSESPLRHHQPGGGPGRDRAPRLHGAYRLQRDAQDTSGTPSGSDEEEVIFKRDTRTVIPRKAQPGCEVLSLDTARTRYHRVPLLSPKPDRTDDRLEWQFCDWGDRDSIVLRALLVPGTIGETGSLATEEIVARGGREVEQQVVSEPPEHFFLSVQQGRPPVTVRGHEASIWEAGWNSRRERFCFLEWAEPEGDRFRLYTMTSPPGSCSSGLAVRWANELVQHG